MSILLFVTLNVCAITTIAAIPLHAIDRTAVLVVRRSLRPVDFSSCSHGRDVP